MHRCLQNYLNLLFRQHYVIDKHIRSLTVVLISKSYFPCHNIGQRVNK